MSGLFERSASGPLGQQEVIECGVCWWKYDPAVGDPEHDLFPGVPFAALPDDFRCPHCDAPKSKFMRPSGGSAATSEDVATVLDVETRADQVKDAFHAAEAAMLGLPVHNPKLDIDVCGFRDYNDTLYTGIVMTPWCMNIVLIPKDPDALPPGPIGSKRDMVFPSGSYSFIAGRMENLGSIEMCSLFSPMDMFDDPAVVMQTAHSIAMELYSSPQDAEPPAEPVEEPANPQRRKLFGAG